MCVIILSLFSIYFISNINSLVTYYYDVIYLDVNQWMVMDLAKFYPGHGPAVGFLTVLEEIPGYIHFEDKTRHLKVIY